MKEFRLSKTVQVVQYEPIKGEILCEKQPGETNKDLVMRTCKELKQAMAMARNHL